MRCARLRWLAPIGVVALAAAGLPSSAQQPGRPAMGSPNAKDPAANRLQAEADKLAKQAKAKPTDNKLRGKVAEAYFQAGEAFEHSKAGLTPHMMYATALHDYNVALSYNPHHAQAVAEKKQIEDIYRSMGRPIPK